MNRLVGENLSIITDKPQTTRKRILGILSDENYQIIFLDTPGMLKPKYLLQEKLVDYIERSVKDADVIVFMITVKDLEKEKKIFASDDFQKMILKSKKPKLLLINKVDLTNSDKVNSAIKFLDKDKLFDRIIPLSATEGYNVSYVLDSIIEYLPEHPKYYPDDQLTTEDERFFVSEKIREKILEIFHDEIPYSVEVVIEDFKERKKGKDYISAVIVVERESQKPIILGKKGAKIKKLGNLARKSIEEFLMREVYLELRVKVKDNWRKNERVLKNFGYIN
jgi:GTP-binding protein Era